MNKKIIMILLLNTFSSFGQKIIEENRTENEKQQYKKLIELAKYTENKKKSEISKDTLFKKYVYFDYVLNDTNTERKEKRLAQFDTIFYHFKKTVDSLGFKNLDARPVRFYKNHKIYKPFREDIAKETVGGEKCTQKTQMYLPILEKKIQKIL